ncbi:MAG: polysaccharide deacetylase family protein [Firmicutes bacterium]|nr:polysaccharide deacetylase family protein [Bacillota bacterium]
MSSKQWLLMFLASVLLIALLICAFNYVTDPFGVFGDRFFQWYAFNFTKNPRVAKIAYLDRHHRQYDSYIIGSSASSSFSVELLNAYMDARFFNLFMYGAYIADVTKTVQYIVDHYEVKNLVLNLGVVNAYKYDKDANLLTDILHARTEGSSLWQFYGKYLFANPSYGLEKIRSFRRDGYLPQTFDVFQVATGAYDKSLRDIERIQDLDGYYEKYPVFLNYPKYEYKLHHIDDFIHSVAAIKKLCEEKHINLLVIFFPLYYEYSRFFDPEQVEEVYTRLAEITPFWDFSLHPLNTDPRFFYDETHFRNALGDMALAKIFGDETKYIPQDFGVYVTPANAREQAAKYKAQYNLDDSAYTVKVPILLYHHLADETGPLIISKEQFAAHMKALAENGYTAVSLQQLVDYVEKGVELPPKPVVITFDDGYASNYEIAYPILKKYNLKATIFPIVSLVGKDTYKDTAQAIYPHFNYEQAREMVASGLIEIQSHSYDMHQHKAFEGETAREAMEPLAGEKEEAFIAALRTDFARSRQELEAQIGKPVFALAYPLGKYSDLTEVILSQMGVKVTLSTEPGINTLIKGLPQSLRALKRINVDENTSADELLQILSR